MGLQTITKNNNTISNITLPKYNLIGKLDSRGNTYYAKAKIYEFNKKYIIELINLIKKHPDTDIILENYIKDFNILTEKIDKNLKIDDTESLKNLLALIGISEILLDTAIEDEDIDGILNSFYRIEPELKEFNLI